MFTYNTYKYYCKYIIDEGKQKKMKSSKKLEFNDEVAAFVFKARKPITRQSKKMPEINVELEKIEEHLLFMKN